MTRSANTLRLPLIQALLAILALATATGAAATPLPASDYAVRPACHTPAPGRASCLALRLEPGTATTRARIHALAVRSAPRPDLARASECASFYASSCLAPQNLQSAYFPGQAPEAPSSEPQTIALVDAYDDLNAEADLNTYSDEFGLPSCTKANGCFKQVGEDGSEDTLPFPASISELEAFAGEGKHQREEAEEAEGWALETATDIEMVHAVCQNCHILLIEASGPEYTELEAAENTAVALHATEISNSWGGPEGRSDNSAFNHPGIPIVAAAGDNGYLNWDQYSERTEPGSPYFEGADYPASSPRVVSVGGTKLNLNAGGAYESESAWNFGEGAGGSGCSNFLPAPAWQRNLSDWGQVGCGGHRASVDVSADADPSTGVNIYDSMPYTQEGEVTVPDWSPIGGTSVAAPIIASMFALAGGAHGVNRPAETLYSHVGSSTLHDVTTGGNGQCAGDYASCGGSLSSPLDCGAGAWICNATVGYDGPTGVGTPNGIGAFEPGETPTKTGEESEPKTSPTEETGQGAGSEVGGPKSGEGSGVEPLGGSSPGTTGGGTGVTSSGPQAKSGSAAGAKQVARIFALALTANARVALRHVKLAIAQLAFSLRASQAVKVRVTLAVRVGVGRRAHWQALPGSFSFAVVKGLNRRRLHGPYQLVRAVYRLTISPADGKSRSLVFRVP